MEKQLFEELIRSLKEAKSIAEGKAKPSRKFTVARPKCKVEKKGSK